MLKRLLFVAVLFIIPNTVFAQTDPIVTESTTNSTVTTTTDSTSKILSPPPSAISPSINGSNSDLCTTGVSASVQTQILGFSGGGTVTDLNCERLKLSKTLYDMGMKVAAVSTLCQDQRVFDAMMMAGTPCPIDGKIGDDQLAKIITNRGLNVKQDLSFIKSSDTKTYVKFMLTETADE